MLPLEVVAGVEEVEGEVGGCVYGVAYVDFRAVGECLGVVGGEGYDGLVAAGEGFGVEVVLVEDVAQRELVDVYGRSVGVGRVEVGLGASGE